MKYLNLGCGYTYSHNSEWVNLDFVSTGEQVIAHNLLNGIPFENDAFDLVYHSHVLEHFTKKSGKKFLQECYRVLKKGAILRIAIPDLERITKLYLEILENGMKEPTNLQIKADYDWMLLEMYDQTVRNNTGGDMLNYLSQKDMHNEAFVFERIGIEGKSIRDKYKNYNIKIQPKRKQRLTIKSIINQIKHNLKYWALTKDDLKNLAIGRFRSHGEIHQWMYDRYSLTMLLLEIGFTEINIKTANTSTISNWTSFQLDSLNGETRKPDSLFIEAIK